MVAKIDDVALLLRFRPATVPSGEFRIQPINFILERGHLFALLRNRPRGIIMPGEGGGAGVNQVSAPRSGGRHANAVRNPSGPA